MKNNMDIKQLCTQNDADAILTYLRENGYTEIYARMYGSLGGKVIPFKLNKLNNPYKSKHNDALIYNCGTFASDCIELKLDDYGKTWSLLKEELL